MRTLILLLCTLSCFGQQRFPKVKLLTADTSAADYWQCFTDNGQSVVFSRLIKGSTNKLYKVQISDTSVTRFLPGLANADIEETRPNTAKNGEIAFTGIKDSVNSIWLTSNEGGTATRLKTTGMIGQPFYPCWYPEEEKLMVVSGLMLTSVNRKTGNCVQLTRRKVISCGMPDLSPDGQSVAFAGQRPDGKYNQFRNWIWVGKVNGNNQINPVPLDSCQGRAPSWSPDGKWIAYESTCKTAGGKYVIIIRSADGQYKGQLTEEKWGANHPVWSPDGNKIAMSVIQPGNARKTCIGLVTGMKEWLQELASK